VAVNTTNRTHGGQSQMEVQSQVGHTQGSKMPNRHYYRPHFEQLMDSIKPYDDYMEKLLQQENALIKSEGDI
jgi:hypothetical protein